MADKDNSFSFDNDPGRLTEKSDVEFTFSDIPVLGVSKDKKDFFSFDHITAEDAAIASFEEMLKESQPVSDGEESQSAEDDVEGVIRTRKGKKQKQFMIRIAVAAVVAVLLSCVVGATLFFVAQSRAKAEAEFKKLSPDEQKALEVKRQRDRINSMVGAADGAYNSDEFDSAAAQYEAVLELEPDNPAALTGKGLCLLQKGSDEDAEAAFRLALEQPGADYRPFEGIARILSGRGDAEEGMSVLEAAHEKFPDENYILIPLADSYHAVNSRVQAIEAYKKIPQQILSEKSLRNFAELMRLESREEAKKIYLYMANKFGGLYPYEQAASLTGDIKDKVLILSDSVAALKEDKLDIDNARFLYSEALVESGDKAKAASTFKEVKVPMLKPEYQARVVVTAKQAGIDDMKVFLQAILQGSPDDFALQKSILEQARLNLDPELVMWLYSDWWSENKGNAVANYLFAKSLGFSPGARRYYEAALAINPEMYDASLELGNIAMAEKNWNEAAKAFKHCANMLSDDKSARYYYALVAIKNGGGNGPIEDYKKFLESLGHDRVQIALEIVDLALLLDSPELADKCLAIISGEPRMKEHYRLFKAKRYLLFKSGDPDAFSHSPKTGLYREYCFIDMLSRGQEREVLMMPTSAEEFPEFWKVFISRRRNIKNWERSAELLLEKNKHETDPTYRIIASIWLGMVSLDDAEKMFNRIPFDRDALLYMILAEEYRWLNQMPSAKIRYRKARDCGRNIYSGVVDFYSRQLR